MARTRLYISEQYLKDSGARSRGGAPPVAPTKRRQDGASARSADRSEGPLLDGPDAGESVENPECWSSDTAAETAGSDAGDADETHVLRMLYKGNVQELNRNEEQRRVSTVHGQRHDYYRHTRCTGVAQEEQSAVPAGAINVYEDSDDDLALGGESLEIEKECQELRAAQSWVNQEGWDLHAESLAISAGTGRQLDLRLDWCGVQSVFDGGASASSNAAAVEEAVVLNDYSLEDLDPTQRVFANRVLTWAAELRDVYLRNRDTGTRDPPPLLRCFLCGSAGSGKSTTLRTALMHVRLLFQKAQIDATVELTAYTGVAAFNIGFGAKTACSAFRVFPNAPWKPELEGQQYRQLEEQWRNVVLLIVDEVSFIGAAFFAKMHFRLQQAKRAHFSSLGVDPNERTFGDISIVLVGDFGQLEPIDDFSMVDAEATYQSCPKRLRHIWRHARQGRLLLQEFKEAFVLRRIRRSASDMWWTESCLRLRDFEMLREQARDNQRQ